AFYLSVETTADRVSSVPGSRAPISGSAQAALRSTDLNIEFRADKLAAEERCLQDRKQIRPGKPAEENRIKATKERFPL
ncbi:hypothetical protein JS562_46215, partial [Agrobacterium sp. S2]|nr:hypothetical protein [Agrobacterium sp. S2]